MTARTKVVRNKPSTGGLSDINTELDLSIIDFLSRFKVLYRMPHREDVRSNWGQSMKHTGIRISDIDVKDGKVVPKKKYRSVSQKIADRKNPKRKYKRGK